MDRPVLPFDLPENDFLEQLVRLLHSAFPGLLLKWARLINEWLFTLTAYLLDPH